MTSIITIIYLLTFFFSVRFSEPNNSSFATQNSEPEYIQSTNSDTISGDLSLFLKLKIDSYPSFYDRNEDIYHRYQFPYLFYIHHGEFVFYDVYQEKITGIYSGKSKIEVKKEISEFIDKYITKFGLIHDVYFYNENICFVFASGILWTDNNLNIINNIYMDEVILHTLLNINEELIIVTKKSVIHYNDSLKITCKSAFPDYLEFMNYFYGTKTHFWTTDYTLNNIKLVNINDMKQCKMNNYDSYIPPKGMGLVFSDAQCIYLFNYDNYGEILIFNTLDKYQKIVKLPENVIRKDYIGIPDMDFLGGIKFCADENGNIYILFLEDDYLYIYKLEY